MELLEQLLTTYNLLFCLTIVGVVWFQRKCAELFVEKLGTWTKKPLSLKSSKVWNDLFVPLGPLGTGAFIAMMPQAVLPEMFSDGLINKMVFGVGMGLLSGFMFRLIKKTVFDRLEKPEEKSLYEFK